MEKPQQLSMQYVDIIGQSMNSSYLGRLQAKANIMTKMAALRLGIIYKLINTTLKMVNAPPTLICGVVE